MLAPLAPIPLMPVEDAFAFTVSRPSAWMTVLAAFTLARSSTKARTAPPTVDVAERPAKSKSAPLT